MAIFYMAFALADLMLLSVGNTFYKDGKEYLCLYTWYLISQTNSGSWYLLFHEIFYYLFSVLIWYIFYKIPDNHGLIKKLTTKDLYMPLKGTTIVLNEGEFVDELKKISEEEHVTYTPIFIRRDRLFSGDSALHFEKQPHRLSSP